MSKERRTFGDDDDYWLASRPCEKLPQPLVYGDGFRPSGVLDAKGRMIYSREKLGYLKEELPDE